MKTRFYVLILILMEHAQRDVVENEGFVRDGVVLILILMEHAQRGRHYFIFVFRRGVLILILMEHAQRDRSSPE